MANTRLIKRRINAAANISKITKAMEMVAASKMKRAQEQATQSRPFSRSLEESLHKLSAKQTVDIHPLLSRHEEGEDVLIMVGTDKGLCGNLNGLLFKQALEWRKQHPHGKMIAIGRKSVQFAKFTGFELYAQFIDLPEKLSILDIAPLHELTIQGFLDHTFRSVTLLYTDFINTLSHHPRMIQMLPIMSYDVNSDENDPNIEVVGKSEYVFEPSAASILAELLPYYIENTLYQAFLEARASEHSARMVTMKNASENAHDLVAELKLEFNKTRQAGITAELLDMISATMSLS
ncbi:MAG TPA: ATP synthase F1 subunit gamma [Patescibacteria group bacterium]